MLLKKGRQKGVRFYANKSLDQELVLKQIVECGFSDTDAHTFLANIQPAECLE
jgi:hypothetical protein